MSRDQHPAQRHLSVVQDTVATSEWWEAERAAARRDNAVARLASCTAWCLVTLTAVTVAILVLDAWTGR